MRGKLSKITLAVLVLSLLTASVALVGGAAAQTDTATATPTVTDDDSTDLVAMPTNETLSVDNDTEALRATAENTNGTLSVTVYGIDADGNETQVATGSLNASGADATDVYEYTAIDAANYSSYRVHVEGDGAEHLNIAKVQVVSGGGGLIGDFGGRNVVAGLGALVVLGALGVGAYLTGRY